MCIYLCLCVYKTDAYTYIYAFSVTEKDKFMVVASDGVWEFLSNEQVIEIVNGCDGDAELACRYVLPCMYECMYVCICVHMRTCY